MALIMDFGSWLSSDDLERLLNFVDLVSGQPMTKSTISPMSAVSASTLSLQTKNGCDYLAAVAQSRRETNTAERKS